LNKHTDSQQNKEQQKCKLSRRDFIAGSGALLLTGILGGCTAESLTSTVTKTNTSTLINTITKAITATETATATSMITSTATVTGTATVTETVTAISNIVYVTDYAERTVAVDTTTDRIATIVGPGYEKVFMLGEADRVVYGMGFSTAWALKTNPNAANITKCTSTDNPNIEELLSLDIGLIFYFNYTDIIADMEEAGLTVLAALPGSTSTEIMDDFIGVLKKEVRLYGTALGVDAKAEAWCSYMDEKIEYVNSRISALSEDEYPTVHIVGGSSIYSVFTRYAKPYYYVKMAGGKLVSGDIMPTSTSTSSTVTIEQILEWNPDVIFMGRQSSKDAILNEAGWSSLSAVQNGEVYISPHGVFYWDYDSEGILLVMYMAKILHPDLFEDLDMVEEVKYYYQNFYGYPLTDDEAERILNHLDPAD
jgi:iron complex transport system substrate-binding protein